MVKTKLNLAKLLVLLAGTSAVVMAGGLAKAKIQQPPALTEVELNIGETEPVRFVIDGDGFILDSGLKVKLAVIEAPQKAWAEKERTAQPLSEEASEYLSTLIAGKQVGLFYSGDTRDRYERAVGQVWTLTGLGEKDIWVQHAMVEAGYARVYPWRENEYGMLELYKAEQAARKARRGIWNNRRTKSFYKVRMPEENALVQKVDSIQIVEGVIVSSADVNGTVYLNFGADYKTDFTVGIGKSSRKAFERAGIDPVKLTGARVRVRGWLELQNGPMIWLNTPNRLEIVE